MEAYFYHMFDAIDSNIHLDFEQIEAILCEGNSIIVAGAGSGKTTTMAAKVKYLVDILKVPPKDIMVISFTNKAVLELQERIQADFGIDCGVMTFHRFALSILKSKGISYRVFSDMKNYVEKYLGKKFLLWKKWGFPSLSGFTLFLEEFLHKFKMLGYDSNQIIQWISVEKGKEKKSFLQFFLEFYNDYQEYLVQNGLLDFEDMIIRARKEVDSSSHPYRYIIVDEYQDISYQRFLFIYRFHELFGTYLVAVGDDWQAIFAFAGASIQLFTQYTELIEGAKMLKITHTYRNSQELIDIAGKFVMKNVNQISKSLVSPKHLRHPIRIYVSKHPISILNRIVHKIVKEFGMQSSILFLGRYHFDIGVYLDNRIFKKKGQKILWKYGDVSITFLTCHASKGLGFDNVVLLHVIQDSFGFPSTVLDHPYMEYVLPKKEEFPFAEERRLFYVALTRTKNRVYIVTERKKVSFFVRELKKMKI